MATFIREALELPMGPEHPEAERLDPNWVVDHREWLPPLTRLPSLQLLPVGDVGTKENLHDLLTEYVNRKYAVLTDFVGQAPTMRHRIMSPTAWAKLEAIKRMPKEMQVPIMG